MTARAPGALKRVAPKRAALGLCAVAILGAAAAAAPGDAPSSSSSDNWSGYAVSGTRFAAVEAEWVQPAATCAGTFGGSTAASFWVGLGGNGPRQTTSKVEQIGTDSDCDPRGRSFYYAWYELWPQDAVELAFRVAPGDTLWASVEVHANRVVLRLSDLNRGTSLTRSLKLADPDTTSAEWIAEVPSLPGKSSDQRAALTDFGSVRFADASATSASGRTGPISSPAWHATAIGLSSNGAGGRGGEASSVPSHTDDARGVPSPLNPAGDAFSVTWRGGEEVKG